ncbi:MAG: protein TolQ [Gammaproteobacteria bacterium]|nr:protein TolQ [Gammaproteobacteria bacterium]
MIVSTDQQVINLILSASLIVKIVIGMLIAVSLYSWTIIFLKRSIFSNARKQAEQFERRFWSGIELGELYRKVSERRDRLRGLEAIFESGFREFIHLRKQAGNDPAFVMEGAQRAMRVALNREYEFLETHLSFLATVGSTSPYVGLFGTVWGIMNAFLGLSKMQAASIETVAPGIAEALIATAFGLLAAIPAVIAYNRFANHLERVIGRFDNFVEEFSTVLQRQARN